MLSQAGVAINGQNPWDIRVKEERLFTRVLRDKNIGLGESYMEGWWDCSRLDEFIYRILAERLDEKIMGGFKLLLSLLPDFVYNRQSRSRSHSIAECHYDLGNDLFMSFLDPYNQYSCAYFRDTDDLHQAQLNKLYLICKKIGLGPNDHVLDIVCMRRLKQSGA